jgi:hypothetical protein
MSADGQIIEQMTMTETNMEENGETTMENKQSA